MCPNLHLFLVSPYLFSALPLVFPFSPLSVLYLFLCLPLFASPSLLGLSLFCILPPRPPPLLSPPHPSVSTRQRVIHLHWGDTCAVLTVRALTEWEEGKQQPHDSKDTLSVGKHIRPSITEANPTTPTVWVLSLPSGSMIRHHWRGVKSIYGVNSLLVNTVALIKLHDMKNTGTKWFVNCKRFFIVALPNLVHPHISFAVWFLFYCFG